jgi:hypothetical protein
MATLFSTTVAGAKPADKDYKLTDGAGLYLLVRPNGSKLWRFNYVHHGKHRTLAFGVWPEVSLVDARSRPAFAFDDSKAMCITPPLVILRVRRSLCVGVGKEQSIGHIVAPRDGQILLAQGFRPTEHSQHRPDEIILGLTLVRPGILWEGGGNLGKPRTHGGDIDSEISAGAFDGFNEIISGEQRTGNEQSGIGQKAPPNELVPIAAARLMAKRR